MNSIIINSLRKKTNLLEWSEIGISLFYLPRKVRLKSLVIKKGDTPNAEKVSWKIVNLPTGINVTKEAASQLVKILAQKVS